MFAVRVVYSVLWNTLTYGAVLFLTAGTLHWWRAWVLLGVLVVATVATMLGVMRTRPDLLRERLKGLVQKGQPRSDRVIVLCFIFAYFAAIAFIPMSGSSST